MKLAGRISRISVSQTMAVKEAAVKLREQGIDVGDFGPGEPDLPTPENIKQAGIKAIQGDFTKYTPIGGIKDLRKAIVEKHNRDFASRYDIAQCFANIGGKHAIFNIFSAVIDEGDDVIIPTPYWVSFGDIARSVAANVIFCNTKESEPFRLTAHLIEQSPTPTSSVVLVNSRNITSGAVLDEDEFVKITGLCKARDVLVLPDECYSPVPYDGCKPSSVASYQDWTSHLMIP